MTAGIRTNRIREVKKISKNDFLLYIAFASFAFISSYPAKLTFDVPFPGVLIFLLFFGLYFISNSNRKIVVNIIPLILVIRAIFFSINAMVLQLDLEIIVAEWATTIIGSLILICFYNFGTYRAIKNIFLIFSFVTSLQLCLSFLANGISQKGTIVAGIGASNYAATFLLLCVSYLLFTKLKGLEKLVVLLDIVVLLLTQSFGAYLALAVALFVFIVKKAKQKKRQFGIYIFLALSVSVVAALLFFTTSFGAQVLEKIQDKFSALMSGDWKVFGSSRLEVYKCSIENFKKHMLFGSIRNPVEIMYDRIYFYEDERAHNFLLESLVRYGLVGTFLNAIVLFIILKKSFAAYKKDRGKFGFIVTIFCLLIHGLVEPNFFTMHFEFFFFIVVGGALSPKFADREFVWLK